MITSSTAGLKGSLLDGSDAAMGYVAAKHGLVRLMRAYANLLAADSIRVNTVHPTGVNTPMFVNEAIGQFIAENPQFTAVIRTRFPCSFSSRWTSATAEPLS